MLLAIDVGNTNLTFAVFEKDNVVASFRMTTKQPRTSDEFGISIRELLSTQGISGKSIDAVIIASVVPAVMHALTGSIIKYMGIQPVIVGPGTRTGIRLDLANTKEVGADKIVDAVAAYELYGGPVIVIDFGTATTYDFITAEGALTGGVISPGIKICANALWNEAAKLPEIEIALPSTILGKDTTTCMQGGLVFGYIGQTEYIVRKMINESGCSDVKVVATGGLGKLISDNTDSIQIYDPLLTMKGLKIIYDKTLEKRR